MIQCSAKRHPSAKKNESKTKYNSGPSAGMNNMAKFKIKFKHVVIGAVAVAGAAKVASMILESKSRKWARESNLALDRMSRERALDNYNRTGNHTYHVKYTYIRDGRRCGGSGRTIQAPTPEMAVKLVENMGCGSHYDYYVVDSVEMVG